MKKLFLVCFLVLIPLLGIGEPNPWNDCKDMCVDLEIEVLTQDQYLSLDLFGQKIIDHLVNKSDPRPETGSILYFYDIWIPIPETQEAAHGRILIYRPEHDKQLIFVRGILKAKTSKFELDTQIWNKAYKAYEYYLEHK